MFRKEKVMARPREAFTKVELLVVINIVITLMGLLMPVVAKAWEAVRCVQCQNNLRAQWHAIMNYEVSHGKYPPGYLGPMPDARLTDENLHNSPWTGYNAFILAHMGQDANYNQLSAVRDQRGTCIYFDAARKSTPWWENPRIVPLASTPISLLNCPSAPAPVSSGRIGIHVYDQGWDLFEISNPANGRAVASTNYVGISHVIVGTATGGWGTGSPSGKTKNSNGDVARPSMEAGRVFSFPPTTFTGFTPVAINLGQKVLGNRSGARTDQLTQNYTLLFGESLGYGGAYFSWMGPNVVSPLGLLSNGPSLSPFTSGHPATLNFMTVGGSTLKLPKNNALILGMMLHAQYNSTTFDIPQSWD
jgi:competence protein ComGC